MGISGGWCPHIRSNSNRTLNQIELNRIEGHRRLTENDGRRIDDDFYSKTFSSDANSKTMSSRHSLVLNARSSIGGHLFSQKKKNPLFFPKKKKKKKKKS